MTDDWRTSVRYGSMTVCGGSQAGKTTFLRYLHQAFPGPSVFFCVDAEPEFGTEVTSVDQLADALGDGATEVAFRVPVTTIADPDVLRDVVQYLLALGKRLREMDAQPMQLILDECHDLDDDLVEAVMKRMKKKRIKPVVASQDPVSVPKRVRTVADYNVWLSPPPDDMRDFLDRSRYPLDLLVQLDRYDALVLGDGWQPVTRIRAPEEHAVE